jgi:hypothetical protein
MDLPGPGRLALALLLASTAVAAAFLYGEGLHGSERHAFAGTTGSHLDNATLLVYPYDDAQPGDIVRIEEDTAARYPYPLDLYVVPLGEGLQVPNGTARVLLHVPFTPPTSHVVGPDGIGSSNTTRNITFSIYPNDGDVVRQINRQLRVPAGVHGIDLAWYNATQPNGAGITVVLTRAEGLWLAMEPGFLTLEAALILATVAVLVPWRRHPTAPPPPTGPPGLPDVAALFTAAGAHLRQLRDTMAAAGLFLLVAILLGRQLLWGLLRDRVGVWAPGLQDTVQASYLAAAAAVLACWLLMAWRVQRQLRAWRRHAAQNPLA